MSLWAGLVLRIHVQYQVGGRNGFFPTGRAGSWDTGEQTCLAAKPLVLDNFIFSTVLKHNFLYFWRKYRRKGKEEPPGEGEALVRIPGSCKWA